MATKLDMEKIAQGLGAKRQGRVPSSGGYFGALQLVADVQSRFRVPQRGGRPTDPDWTERRLIPLNPQTLKRLDELSVQVKEQTGVRLEPMQVAALLLERAAARVDKEAADDLLRAGRRAS